MVSITLQVRVQLALGLAPQREAATRLRRSAATLNQRLTAAKSARIAATARVTPFANETTVHQAWARHPAVPAIFGRYELHACPDCAVGADETLEEAAFGYGIPLSALIAELNGLLRG